MKYITVESCKMCPFILKTVNRDFCGLGTKLNLSPRALDDNSKVADFCKLEDYPKTVNEFLKGKI